jgi:hypothetical protein
VIRIRRVTTGLPFLRTYELQFAASATEQPRESVKLHRGAALRRLERDIGTGDAWSFITAADQAWRAGDQAWAVEYETPTADT